METSNSGLHAIYINNDINWQNFTNLASQPKQININNKMNKNPIENNRYLTYNESNIGKNNVHLNACKKSSENDPLFNLNNILNDQNINTLNMNLIPRNTNQPPKIIVQKLPNKESNVQKYFHPNLTEKNPADKNMIEQKENKEIKGNYQYIVKNVKKINKPPIPEKNEINDLEKNSETKEEEININRIREELISIHDNRKYNYDKKVQRINPKKIQAPLGQKLVERILGMNKKNETKKDCQNNKTNQTPNESVNAHQIINSMNSNDFAQNGILRQNIRKTNLSNNIHLNNDSQPVANNKMNQIIDINNKNINNENNFNNAHLQMSKQNQISNRPQNIVINNAQIIPQMQFNDNHIKSLPKILSAPKINNIDQKNVTPISNQQIIKEDSHQTLALIQKLNQKNINNCNNNLNVSPNIRIQNQNIPNTINNRLYNQNNNNNSTYKKNQDANLIFSHYNDNINFNDFFKELKDNEEIEINEPIYLNEDTPQNMNITVQNISSNINMVGNRDNIPSNPNFNDDIKQFYMKQGIYMNQQQNMKFKDNQINLNQNNTSNNINIQQNLNNNANINKINMIQNSNVMNNNNIYNINNKENMNQNNIKQNVPQINNNNQNLNYQNQQNIFVNAQKMQLQQVPNNTIIGNIIIKDGKAYYLNPVQNSNINPNINENYNHQLNIQNRQIPNQINQNQIYNLQNNNMIAKNNNIMNNNQIMNNQIIYKDQNGNIINISKPPQQPQQPKQQPNPQPQLRNGKIKKKKLSRVARILQEKDSRQQKPTLQYQVERNRPVYAVPPSKKRSVSQGKPFTLINKYYDNNYILEDDKEEDDKNDEINNIHIEKNLSEDENNDNDDEKSTNSFF